ncbi:hypothetical protein D3C87_1220460 [compost metagenome]
MPIDTILQPRIPSRIDSLQPVQRHRRGVRQDQPRPHQQHAPLPKRHLAVITPDQSRALRDQQVLARGRVVDRLCDVGDHLSRQVRVDPSHQCRRDDRPRHHLVRRRRQLQAARIARRAIPRFRQERFLRVLPALDRGRIGRCRLRRRSCHRIESLVARSQRWQIGRRLRCHRRLAPAAVATAPEKHRRPRRFLGRQPLGLFRINAATRRAHLHWLLRLHDGRPEIPRQWRPQHRRSRFRQPCIVLRQPLQVLGARNAVHVEQFGAGVAVSPARAQGPQRGAEHRGAEPAHEHRQHAAVEPHDGPRRSAQRHGLRSGLWRNRGSTIRHVGRAHAQFLRAALMPSVRSMRTICALSPPSLSSAAPKRRSTT